jgi:hypothetical protein
LSTWVLEYLSTWVLEYLSTWVLEYLSTWVLEYFSTWVLEYLSTWVPEYLSTWVPEYLSTWVLEYLSTWVLEYLRNRVLEYSNNPAYFACQSPRKKKSFLKFVSVRQPSLTVDHNLESCPHRFKKDASTSGTASIKLWGPGTVFTTLWAQQAGMLHYSKL